MSSIPLKPINKSDRALPLSARLLLFWQLLLRRLRAADHPERGDVPGWVMVTLMSALLVAALLAIAGPALTGMFNDAIQQVHK
ncbi:hypothetical protein [Psychromicrobium lacuslunae]|uniref:Uncharacterized protein n=1 Tax=Psychromicrobium lacuslunae TaxID=1618207 RepID=A0A0D4BY57_9MICC|nr:hypothetical protein [Psychromicrobium lacuslunae]AJT41402.1 hypothetical protein UM93_07515 [Psychromicrobium lacuslunae]